MKIAVVALLYAGCAAAQDEVRARDTGTDELFSRLEQLAPAHIALQRLECREGQAMVTGISDRISEVSRYMRNIADAGWAPILDRIEARGNKHPFVFTVSAVGERRDICRETVRYYPAAAVRRSRTDADIQIVFDKHKHELYAIYVAALKQNPSLGGKLIVKFTILPSGRVVQAAVASSGLNDHAFEGRFLKAIEAIDFGPKSAPPARILYPIDFLPPSKRATAKPGGSGP